VEPSVVDSILADEEQVVASMSATSAPAHSFFADEYTATYQTECHENEDGSVNYKPDRRQTAAARGKVTHLVVDRGSYNYGRMPEGLSALGDLDELFSGQNFARITRSSGEIAFSTGGVRVGGR
jgi:hypothetical protein